MKKYFLNIIWILCLTTVTYGQWLVEPTRAFETIFSDFKGLNPYQLWQNPAFLYADSSAELLSIQSTYNQADGDFRQFMMPEKNRLIQERVSGKKTIDNVQVFKGSFGFQKEIRSGWAWLATKNYDRGNPFLLGDSTVGQTHYNGIVMDATYNRLIGKKMSIGAEFNYFVDEGLKEVSPKPTSKHRDMDFRLGFGYQICPKLSLGILGRVTDFNEEIAYREDEGSLYQETILFKFSGYAYPQVFNKKVETRYSYDNGYFGYTTLTYEIPAKLKLALFAGQGIEQIVIKDDALLPRRVGYWQNESLEAGMNLLWQVLRNHRIGLKYSFEQNEMWARHPQFKVRLMENQRPEQQFLAGWEFQINPKIATGIEGGVAATKFDEKDYYSSIFWKADAQKAIARVGCDIFWTPNFQSFLGYGFQQNSVDIDEFSAGSTILSSQQATRINDVYYWLSDYTQHQLQMQLSFKPPKLGIFKLFLTYSRLTGDTDSYLADRQRDDVQISLEYLVKVY